MNPIEIYTSSYMDKEKSCWAVILLYGDYVKKMNGSTEYESLEQLELYALIAGLNALKKQDIPIQLTINSHSLFFKLSEKEFLKEEDLMWKELYQLFIKQSNLKLFHSSESPDPLYVEMAYALAMDTGSRMRKRLDYLHATNVVDGVHSLSQAE
ncbi:TPA: hypothetical protein NJY08_005111 [Salmonella enterica subsp. enterica serovar Typhi str. AG3]|nr:hypothetical protein [Salmonella enterica subsp. enterica serovar Typhi str. AG3]